MPNFLKRLELNGFKSFSGKTVLEFPAGITAIVGPNGSGKSNLVDSIRWLLGEREARNLRGGKVEDLIFAGTPHKPRQSLAQASLHFDNQSGSFPVDFKEVTVMREVSRDGVSRYFLNKAEIRLKDLIDFFAKAKLGTKGFTIATQGNSDQFIRSTPAERREMIEEMLGLREYQIKKTRALNQLKNTQINLEKVQALIDEIKPHLRSLRRQTSRWEKRGLVEENLKNLEDIFFGSQHSWLKTKISETQKEADTHKKELTVFEEEKRKAEAHQKEIEAKEPKEREELKKIKAQTQELLEKQSRLQKNLGRLEAQLEAEKEKADTLPAPNQLLNLIKKVKTQLEAKLHGEAEELRRAVSELLHEIDAALGILKEGKPALPQSLKSQFEAINKELEEIEAIIVGLREKEKHLEKSQEQFYESFKAAVSAVENAKSKIEERENKNQERRFGKERLTLRFDELIRQIHQAGRKPEEFASLTLGNPINLATKGLDAPELRDLERKIFKLRGDLAAIGEVDETIVKEARETEERYQFLTQESEDIEKARADLKQLISDLSEKIKVEFSQALVKINKEFNSFFHVMFDGGHAKLRIVKRQSSRVSSLMQGRPVREGSESNGEETEQNVADEKNEESGLDIDLSLPRKRLKSLDVLSGGERSLVGIAALFALISVSPPPFLVLDEIDAALDDRNAKRFADIVKEFSKKTQFIIVTHNRATMEAAHLLYGVTLNQDGTSKILSLKLEPEK